MIRSMPLSTDDAAGRAHTRPTLLIADDDPVVRSTLSLALERDFDIVGVAADAAGSIELAEQTQPDAALIDVQMPGGGGRSAVRGIVTCSPRTAVVMLSSDESDAGVRELMSAGAVTYVRKGDPRELPKLLTRAVRAHHSERAS